MDTASPTVSVAVGRGGEALAVRSVELRRSSEALLRLVDEALEEAGAGLRDLDGILALRGPGSFTGLRVGLATAFGLHQALGTPATAVPTLEVLVSAAQAVQAVRAARAEDTGGTVQDGARSKVTSGDTGGTGGTVSRTAAVVDALRGQWFTQLFTDGDGAGEAAILDPAQVAAHRPAVVVGHGAARLADAPEGPRGAEVLDLADPAWSGPTLAEAALLYRPRSWDPDTLTHPLYLRAPAVTLPKRRPVPLPPAAEADEADQDGR